MSSISSIAASGMAAATARLQGSANRVSNVGADADVADELVQQIAARVSFAANAKVMTIDAQMTKALLDITV